jgi:hypothetical protein
MSQYTHSVSLLKNLSRSQIAAIGKMIPNTPPNPLHPEIPSLMASTPPHKLLASFQILPTNHTNAMGITTAKTPPPLFIPHNLYPMISLLYSYFVTVSFCQNLSTSHITIGRAILNTPPTPLTPKILTLMINLLSHVTCCQYCCYRRLSCQLSYTVVLHSACQQEVRNKTRPNMPISGDFNYSYR